MSVLQDLLFVETVIVTTLVRRKRDILKVILFTGMNYVEGLQIVQMKVELQ